MDSETFVRLNIGNEVDYMGFIQDVMAKAKADRKRVVLPEGTDRRVLEAARQLTDEQVADIILTGSREEIEAKAEEFGIGLRPLSRH